MATEGFKKAGPQKIPDGVTLEAGAALVRQGDRALFVMAGGQTKAKLDPVAPVPQGQNEVLLRGSLSEAAEAIHGIINQGTHGFASCRSEPVAPPGFALRCPMARGDGSAWIDVVSRAPKKLLSRSALHVLATREGARAPYAPAALPSRAKGDFTQALVANLNAVRAQGKLSPLRVSTEQAALNERHAGSILGGLEDEKSDRLALGLMAGWDVQGMIRRGNLLALVSSSTGDPGEWLSEALDMPLARSILLEPDQRVVAVGAASAAGRGGIGAVITTYALFESNEHAAEVAQVIDQLNAARARRGLAPATLLRELAPLDAAAARVFKDEQGVEEALQAALNEASGQLNRPAQGAYFEAIDLDALEFPEPLLAPQPPTVAIAVTHHKAPGAAWGQYVVLLVALPGGGQQQARAAAPARL